jgi:hypothetical protein
MSSYEFRVYNRRNNNEVTYTVTKTETGWHIRHIAINGECKPDGSPFFYENFHQNYISYPSSFGGFLEFIWSGLHREELSTSDAQVRLQEIADWVSHCERTQPEWEGLNV